MIFPYVPYMAIRCTSYNSLKSSTWLVYLSKPSKSASPSALRCAPPWCQTSSTILCHPLRHGNSQKFTFKWEIQHDSDSVWLQHLWRNKSILNIYKRIFKLMQLAFWIIQLSRSFFILPQLDTPLHPHQPSPWQGSHRPPWALPPPPPRHPQGRDRRTPTSCPSSSQWRPGRAKLTGGKGIGKGINCPKEISVFNVNDIDARFFS